MAQFEIELLRFWLSQNDHGGWCGIKQVGYCVAEEK
jgi:hypothetical protein